MQAEEGKRKEREEKKKCPITVNYAELRSLRRRHWEEEEELGLLYCIFHSALGDIGWLVEDEDSSLSPKFL